jgi:tetratricopeptide (TPR) repeat protein
MTAGRGMDDGAFDQVLGQAQVLAAQGRYDDALPLAQLALQLAPAMPNPSPRSVAASANTLAEIHRNLGDPGAAEPLYVQALEIIPAELGEYSEAHGVVLTNLALARYEQGNLAGAEPPASQALEILVGVHGAANPAVENTLRLLAAVRTGLGDDAGAIPYRMAEVDSATARLGPRHNDVMALVNEVAVLANNAGALDESRRLCERYLEYARGELAGSLELAVALENLAHVDSRLWRQAEAAELLGEAVVLRRSLQGDGHEEVTVALDRLALAHQAAGDHAAAVPAFEELAERLRAAGDAAQLARTLNNLGTSYFGAHRLGEARGSFEAALAITRRTKGPRHPDAARSLQSMASVDQLLREYGRAESRLTEAVIIFRDAGEEYRSDAAVAMVNLAELYAATDRPAAAEQAFREALDLRLAAFGPSHPSTSDVERRLAGALHAAGRDAEATLMLERALAGVGSALGEDHPRSIEYRRDLARLLRSAGQLDRARAILEADLPRLDRRPRIETLDDLARLEENRGDLAAAHARLSEVAELYRGAEDIGGLAGALGRLAELDAQLGDTEASLAKRQGALTLLRSVEPATNRDVALAVSAVADVLTATGAPARAVPLYRESMALHQQAGRYREALPAGIRALDLVRSAPAPDPTDLAVEANNLAELYRGAGQPTEAVPLLIEASELLSREPDPDPPTVAMVHNNLGLAYAALGEYGRARQAYAVALRVFRAQPEPTDGLAFALNNLAQTLVDVGENAAADDLLEESLAVRRGLHGTNSAAYATALLNRGMSLLKRSEVDRAKPMLEEALSTLRSQRGDGHPDVTVAVNALGYLHRRLGHYADAENLLRWALSLQEATMAPDDPRIAATLDNLAGVLHARGDVGNAHRLFGQATEILVAHGGPPTQSLGTVLNNHGQLLLEVGRIEEADRILTRALAIAEAAHNDVATATVANNLGLVRSRANDPSAVPLLERGLTLRRSALGEDNPDVAQSLNNVAVAIQDSDPDRARSLLEQSLVIRRRLLGDDHPDVAEAENNLSFLVDDRSRVAVLLEDAVRIRRETNDGPALVDTLTNLALTYVLLDRREEAVELYREAAEVRDRLIDRVAALSTERERLAYLTPVRAELSLFLTAVRARLADQPDAVRLACDLVLRRKGIVAEGVARRRAAVLSGRYPSLRDQIRELDALRAQLARLTLGPSSAESEVTAQIAELQGRYDVLDITLASQVPELGVDRRSRGADVSTIMAALEKGSALVEFVRVTTRDPFAGPAVHDEFAWYAAVVVTADGVDGSGSVVDAVDSVNARFVDLGPADVIDYLVGIVRSAITGRTEGADRDARVGTPELSPDQDVGQRAGEALRELVVDRLGLDQGRRLYLAPDGELTRLPFEVLPTNDGGRLVDEYVISYLSTGRDLLRFTHATETVSSDAVVVADPDYDLRLPASHGKAVASRASSARPTAMRFVRLPGTRKEGVQVAALLGVEPILGGLALEATIKECAGPRVLHIATHGFFEPDSEPPERRRAHVVRSGLALAGANASSDGRALPPEAEDGVLTADDLTGMDLVGTALVVLSACETGLGRVHVGEGVFGLRRAVALAGAETLVMSLWRVPDEESCELMVDFHRRLKAGSDRAQALRAAQLALRERRPDPFYWGAFVCEGNPGPMPAEVVSSPSH